MDPPLQHMGTIPHSSHDNVGYWGPRTASVDWCEPNYVWSPYIAEFWNTVSSVCIVACGVLGVWSNLTYTYKRRFLLPSIFMVGIGCGSIAFHGTLQFEGQALDELSMVYAICCYLFVVLEMEEKVSRPWLPYAISAYAVAFTYVYAVHPRYFDIFVCIFIAGCVWVLLQSVRIYRVTYDVRLRRLFWVGFGVYAAAFFVMWIPDNLACDKVGWLHLHAWFHVCSAIAPYWWIVWATHSFYTHRYSERTGLLRLADGTEVEAPRPLMERLGEHLLPDSSRQFSLSAAHEVHALAPSLARWAEAAGMAWAKRRRASLGSAGSTASGGDDASEAAVSQPTSPTSLSSSAPGSQSGKGGGRRRRRVSASSSGGASDPTETESTGSVAPSRGTSEGHPSPSSAQPIAIVVTDEPLPMPELRWYGPRNLVMVPYVHLEWKDGQAALRQSLEASRLPGRVPVFAYSSRDTGASTLRDNPVVSAGPASSSVVTGVGGLGGTGARHHTSDAEGKGQGRRKARTPGRGASSSSPARKSHDKHGSRPA